MNRRQFTSALGAAAAAPALPLKALTAAPAVATAVPNTARFWAIYMSHLHGSVSAKTLSVMTGLDVSVAQSHLTKLLSDGVIKPNHLLTRLAESNANSSQEPSKWRERLKKFTEEKQESVEEPEAIETDDEAPETEIEEGNAE